MVNKPWKVGYIADPKRDNRKLCWQPMFHNLHVYLKRRMEQHRYEQYLYVNVYCLWLMRFTKYPKRGAVVNRTYFTSTLRCCSELYHRGIWPRKCGAHADLWLREAERRICLAISVGFWQVRNGREHNPGGSVQLLRNWAVSQIRHLLIASCRHGVEQLSAAGGKPYHHRWSDGKWANPISTEGAVHAFRPGSKCLKCASQRRFRLRRAEWQSV